MNIQRLNTQIYSFGYNMYAWGRKQVSGNSDGGERNRITANELVKSVEKEVLELQKKSDETDRTIDSYQAGEITAQEAMYVIEQLWHRTDETDKS